MELNAERIAVGGANAQLDTDDLAMVDDAAIERAFDFLKAIEGHATRAKAAIAEHRERNNDIEFYHDHHLAEVGPEVAGRDVADCLDRLTPVAVWFSLDEDGGDWEASIDYSLGEDVTDYLLSARMAADGMVIEVTMES